MAAFIVILIVLAVIYFAMKGKGDRPEQLGAAKRGMTSGHIGDHAFVSPYAKCPACGASGDGMKANYDGTRTVKWTCGYCGAQAGIQELKDDELPLATRRRLGLDPDPAAAMVPQQGGYGPGMQGPNLGGLLTGVMLGEMLGGNRPSSGGQGQGSGQDWGESDSSGGGSDWGDSGGGDSGGSDW
ncbi:MAG TPA: hypothetical protein VFF76_02025 [Holophagaceae bacterium]|jgi:hypothetical protein|nr:hypothetical protein [Holophagaceae bacterium]